MLKIVAVIACLLLLSSFENVADSSLIYKNSNAIWTIMIYLAADNHRNVEINSTLKMLEDLGYSKSINFIILTDGIPIGDTKCYYLAKDGLVTFNWEENESDMGNAETLYNFLNLSMSNFPAIHYALFILSTHGSGWQGLGGDTHGKYGAKYLTLLDMEDYKKVLSNVTKKFCKFDIIAFDICVTGMVEVAYQIYPYVNYMIGTEEHGFSGKGDEGYFIEWNYSFFFENLKNNPEMNPKNFAKLIVDCYKPGTFTFKIFNIFEAPRWYPILKCYTTLSAINLSELPKIADSINALSLNLSTNLNEYRNVIKIARENAREYGKLYRKFWFLPNFIYSLHIDWLGYDCFIDLYDFAENLGQIDDPAIKRNCNAIINALQSAIIANKCLPADQSHGLSIYFPEYKCQYDVSIWRSLFYKNFWNLSVPYESLSFSRDTYWDDFLREYLYI